MVGVALPKGDRQKWLVEKLTELGVTALVPLVTERGVAQPTAARWNGSASRDRGLQAMWTKSPDEISEPQPWADWISQNPLAGDSAPPAASPSRSSRRRTTSTDRSLQLTTSRTQLAIGPEGGLTDSEVAAAIAADWQAVDLGPRISARGNGRHCVAASTIAQG